MKQRFLSLRDKLNASYWFIPTIMAVLAVLLSIITIKLDEGIGRELRWVTGLVYVDSPEGARAVLSTIASSMITVAGVVFSLMMVVLSLTAQQYGSLILAHFMRDRGNQFVLGVFTSTFIYCLLILRTIHGVETSIFIPHISVLVGLGLAIASLAVLIYFIHHVSESIQAPNIIARINKELMKTIDDMFPSKLGKEVLPSVHSIQPEMVEPFEQDAISIATHESGYLQLIDEMALLKIATTHEIVLLLDVMPGQFLFKGQPLVRIVSKSQLNDDLTDSIHSAFIFGSHRTRTQDIEFIVMQLSALAVRALSPAMNDPYTAMIVIDHLGEALYELLQRQLPSKYRYDEHNQLRVIASPVNFETLFRVAFDQIRHYGHSDLNVTARLLHVIHTLLEQIENSADRQMLRQYATHLYEESQTQLTSSEDKRLDQIYKEIIRTLQPHDERSRKTRYVR